MWGLVAKPPKAKPGAYPRGYLAQAATAQPPGLSRFQTRAAACHSEFVVKGLPLPSPKMPATTQALTPGP